jgi:hypothetical protein
MRKLQYKSIQNLQNLEGYIFYILQHFATKLCNFTYFCMPFQGIYFFCKDKKLVCDSYRVSTSQKQIFDYVQDFATDRILKCKHERKMKLTHPRRKGCLLERGNCFVFLAANCFAKIKQPVFHILFNLINVEEMFALV